MMFLADAPLVVVDEVDEDVDELRVLEAVAEEPGTSVLAVAAAPLPVLFEF